MELDSRKKSRRERMMHSKRFETQEVREIGRKEAGESRGRKYFSYGNNRVCLPGGRKGMQRARKIENV